MWRSSIRGGRRWGWRGDEEWLFGEVKCACRRGPWRLGLDWLFGGIKSAGRCGPGGLSLVARSHTCKCHFSFLEKKSNQKKATLAGGWALSLQGVASFVVRFVASIWLLTLPACSPAALRVACDSWWHCMMAMAQVVLAAAATGADGCVIETALVSWWVRWPRLGMHPARLEMRLARERSTLTETQHTRAGSTAPTTKTRERYVVTA